MKNALFPLSRKEAERLGILYSSEDNKRARFPTLLRELREEKGISQATFAEGIRVTKSTASLYEQGENVPDIKTFARIAKFYDVSYDYLLGNSDSKQRENASVVEKTGLSEDAIEVLQHQRDKALADFLTRLLTYPHLSRIVDEFYEYSEIITNPDDYFLREELYIRATGKMKNAVVYDFTGRDDVKKYTLFKCMNEFGGFVEFAVCDKGESDAKK